jgi:hypothetical protein
MAPIGFHVGMKTQRENVAELTLKARSSGYRESFSIVLELSFPARLPSVYTYT